MSNKLLKPRKGPSPIQWEVESRQIYIPLPYTSFNVFQARTPVVMVTHGVVDIPASCDSLASHASLNNVFQIGILRESTCSESHWHPAEISPEVHWFILRLKSKGKGIRFPSTKSPIYLHSGHSSFKHNVTLQGIPFQNWLLKPSFEVGQGFHLLL